MSLRLFLVITLVLLSGLLVSCGGRNENNYYHPEQERYFQGTQGVVARFVNFPYRLYYYGPDDNSGNEFSLGVELQNEGASFTRGGVYISGFDPTMIMFEEIPLSPDGGGSCGISIGQLSFGQMGAFVRCGGSSLQLGEGGNHKLDVRSVGEFIPGLANSEKAWVRSLANFGVVASYNDGDGYFSASWDAGAAYLERYQHGRLFINLMLQSGMNFIKYSGQEFYLAGDIYEYPGGEYAYFVYNGHIVNWPPGLDQTQQTLLLTTCYQYTTFASPIVCIDPDPYSENRKVCRPIGRSYSSNGAPVAITSIEQENTPKKTIFHINVKNVGIGTVYDPGKLERCSPYYPDRVTAQDHNVIWLGDVRIGTKGLTGREGPGGITCSPEFIRLDPHTRTGSTTCSYPIEYGQIKSAYQAPLTVELWYGYSEVQQLPLTIKRII